MTQDVCLNFRSIEALSILRDKTRRLWTEKYPCVAFDVDETSPIQAEEFETPTTSKIKYDIKSAAMRQGSFYYQVQVLL